MSMKRKFPGGGVEKKQGNPCTVFGLIPETNEKQKYLVVIDKESMFETKVLPVTAEETLLEALYREVYEETGHAVTSSGNIILEIHKRSRYTQMNTHRDIFFLCDPPIIYGNLIKGEEIEYACWERKYSSDTEKGILERIRDGEFFHNHAAAFLWLAILEQYMKTKNTSLLAPFIARRDIRSWHVTEKGALILCFSPYCDECEDIRPEQLYTKPYHPLTKALTNINDTEELYRMPPQAPEQSTVKKDETFAGTVKYVVFYHDRFAEYIYLVQGETKHYLIEENFKEKVSVADCIEKFKKKFGGEYECIGTIQQYDTTVILIKVIGDKTPLGFKKQCINQALPLEFSMSSDDWLVFGIVTPLLEHYIYVCNGQEKRPVVNHHWKSMWPNHVDRHTKERHLRQNVLLENNWSRS